jgi:hypothetical protein
VSTKTYGYYTAGWCGSCGRRRGADGRCPNCDPWWTSALVQTGGPVVICVTLFLILGISLLRGRTNTTTPLAAAPRSAPYSYGASPAMPFATGAPSYPMTSMPAPPPAPVSIPVMAANAAVNRPTDDQIRFAELEQLRRTTAYVDATVEAHQYARAMAERSATYGQRSAEFATAAPSQSLRSQAEMAGSTL